MADYYKLHDFLSVAVESRERAIREGYKHYLRNFQSEQPESDGCKYVVRDFAEFKLPPEYRQDGPYISFSSGFFIPKERYAVVYGNGKIEEYAIYANRATNLWIQALLVPQGVSLAHGAGGSINGKGLLLAGFGGIGKTFLVSELKKRDDFKFFGDDYVMVNQKGEIYAYPTDFSIYPYHRGAFSELKGTPFANYLTRRKIFTPWYEFQQAVNFISRRIRDSGNPVFNGWNARYVKVPADFLVNRDKIGDTARLHAGVFLTRYSGSEMKLEEISKNEFVNALMGNLQVEFQHALPYLNILNTFGLLDVANFFSKQQEILRKCAESIKRYRILIPLAADRQTTTSAIVIHLEKIL